jgi:mitotic spindle assembly checkpoint protein MAD1
MDLKHRELRLRSMFAEHEEDELAFRFESDGSIQMIQTPFAAQLDRKMLAYLTICHSIPAFLSTVTVTLFEKQTFTFGAS